MTEQLSTAQHSTYSLSDNLKIFRYMVTARLRGSQGKYLWVPVYINNLSPLKSTGQHHLMAKSYMSPAKEVPNFPAGAILLPDNPSRTSHYVPGAFNRHESWSSIGHLVNSIVGVEIES